jgi:HD-GYP domain-containing protein (c-di-GMP phosphodiesterase class II)
MEDKFGPSNEIVGRKCFEVYEKRSQFCHGCPTKKTFKDGGCHEAIRAGVTWDGQRRYFHLISSPVKDGNGRIQHVIETIVDVTENKMSEIVKDREMKALGQLCDRLVLANSMFSKELEDLKDMCERTNKLNFELRDKYVTKIKELSLAKEELKKIFKFTRTIASASNIKSAFSLITRLTCDTLKADACSFRMVDEKGKNLILESGYGLNAKQQQRFKEIKLGEYLPGKAARHIRTIISKDRSNFIDDSFCAAISVPAKINGQVLGVITAYFKTPRLLREEEIKLLETLAIEIAIAAQETKLYRNVYETYFHTIQTLVLAMESRDPYVKGHSERVMAYSLEIGRKIGLDKKQLEILQYAGQLHDVGKISISDLILHKPGKLTKAERAIIQLHPVRGAAMLKPLNFLEPAIPLVKHHHERFDGKGYPAGLKGTEIPLESRILACADSFDAMVSERPYRIRKLTFNEAIAELKDNCGSQFDSQVVKAFLQVLR